VNRDVFVTDIDHKQHVWQRIHGFDAAQAAFKLFLLTAQHLRLALVVMFDGAVSRHLIKLHQALNGLTYGLEVGEHATQPTLADERHAATLRFLLDRIARGAFSTDEQYFAAIGNHLTNKRCRLVVQGQSLFQIDDMNSITFAEDVRSHLGVPEAGLMSKMNA